MSQTNVNFRMDSELKKDMEELCKALGLNMTTAFTIFATKMCREKRIPFDVAIDPFYSDSNIKALENSIDQLNNGKIVTRTLADLEELADE